MGYGKICFPQKTKPFFDRCLRSVRYPETLFLQVLFKILGIKEGARLGPMLAASWTLPSPKPCILHSCLKILQVSFLTPKNVQDSQNIASR